MLQVGAKGIEEEEIYKMRWEWHVAHTSRRRMCIAEFINLFQHTAHGTRRKNCQGTPYKCFKERFYQLKNE
jgi:hypothetical protein